MPQTLQPSFSPRMKALATYSGSPAQNVWCTVLPATANVRVIGIIMSMATANEDLECRVTIDGLTISGTQVPAVAGTMYTALLAQTNLVQSLAFTATIYVGRGHLFEGRNVLVEIRKTSNNAANVLSGSVMYEVY